MMDLKAQLFSVYPAIDLRNGKVVRLIEGDPGRQTTYSQDPAQIAQKWCREGAAWLHVVNLDGAFGEQSNPNITALSAILDVAKSYETKIQFGGGIRSEIEVEALLAKGISRVVLGTIAASNPPMAAQIGKKFGFENIAAGIDTRNFEVYTHGWTAGSGLDAIQLARQLYEFGFRWAVATDISRDGLESGVNISGTLKLAKASNLKVIASGGVQSLQDIQAAAANDLSGIIVGKALYENRFTLPEALETARSFRNTD